MDSSFWALLPPIVAIGLALLTKEVYTSLFIGIAAGALLFTGFSGAAAGNSWRTFGIFCADCGKYLLKSSLKMLILRPFYLT